MKIRNGFVSNSSSSSFLIIKAGLTDEQIRDIYDHIAIAQIIDEQEVNKGKKKKYEYYEEWSIEENEQFLHAWTFMDNFDLDTFMINEVGVREDDIIRLSADPWGSENFFETKEYRKVLGRMRTKKIKKLTGHNGR